MRRSARVAAAMLVCAIAAAAPVNDVWAQQAPAQDAPDPGAGRTLATNVCSTCHVVAPDQMTPFLNQPAPSFTAIANRPSLDPSSLRSFLAGSHASGMPNPRLTDQQIDNVIGYLQSLRRR